MWCWLRGGFAALDGSMKSGEIFTGTSNRFGDSAVSQQTRRTSTMGCVARKTRSMAVLPAFSMLVLEPPRSHGPRVKEDGLIASQRERGVGAGSWRIWLGAVLL